MADLHSIFIDFNEIIKLSSTKKDSLRKSRNSVRDDIREYFRENRKEYSIKFKGQGSFVMKTTILPLSNEFDIDDGVYIIGSESDRPSVGQAHYWVYKAVENRTATPPSDKNTCIRVIYKNDYHVDLPIYYITDDSNDQFSLLINPPQLAHKSKGWIPSDPYKFKQWFDEKAKDKPQLKRIVRYLKAWSDKKQEDNDQLKFPGGLILTILATNQFIADNRDDVSLCQTLIAIQQQIDDSRFYTTFSCYRPTIDTTENLLSKYSSDSTKKNFLNALDSFITSAKQALESETKKDACAKWQKHLGDRFPCSNIIEDETKSTARVFARPDQIRYDNKSANN